MVPHLKPCPLCGCRTARIGYIRDGASISCEGCGMSTRAFSPDAQQKAAEKWNRRDEAALSAAEPVAIYKGNGLIDCGDDGHHNIELLKLIPANTPLFAAPPAPSVAVKALDVLQQALTEYRHAISVGPKWYTNGESGMKNHLRAWDDRVKAALSAQVQDVADMPQSPWPASDWAIGRIKELEAQAIPEGWQLVPVEPTEEMHNAARDWAIKKYGIGIGRDGSDGCYRAMISAAPAKQEG